MCEEDTEFQAALDKMMSEVGDSVRLNETGTGFIAYV